MIAVICLRFSKLSFHAVLLISLQFAVARLSVVLVQIDDVPLDLLVAGLQLLEPGVGFSDKVLLGSRMIVGGSHVFDFVL